MSLGYRGKARAFLESRGIEVGDLILVERRGKKYRGILMPRSELGDDRHIVLKLENGYNVGIRIDEIDSIELLEKGRAPEIKLQPRVKLRENLPRVRILGTGGTIASKIDYRTGAVHPSFDVNEFLAFIPELADIAFLEFELLMNILSEDMKAEYWIEIARSVYKSLRSGVDGVVITHGTDTLHYTSSALSFMVRELPSPVVLVGAQRSSDRPSTDAVLNMISATTVAARSDIAEVVVVMHGSSSDDYCLIHRGTKVRKMHTSRRDTFRSINDLPLGKVENGQIIMFRNDYRRREDREPLLEDKLEERVALIYVHPNINPKLIDFFVDEGYRGLVLAGTGFGHCPDTLLPSIRRARREGVAIVMTSQCLYGRVNMNVYSRGRELLAMGVIPGEDMLPEVAYTKLMWVLGKTEDEGEIRRLMLTNIAGEITERTRFDCFLI